MLTLQVEKRKIPTNTNGLRKDGKLPAVFYGRKEASTPVATSYKDFLKVWKEAGETSVINLKGEGVDVEALIQDVTMDPVKDIPLHADFYVIEKGKKLTLNIPVEFVGVAPAVKDLGGTLVKVLHEIEIEALPKDIPHKLEVDISSLINFESRILAQDIKLPEGVELVTKAEEVLALAAEVKEEEEVVAPVDLSAIEVVGEKGKKDEDGEEREAPAEKA